MKKSLLLFIVFSISSFIFADTMSDPRVTYDKSITLDKAFVCYLNFAPKTDNYNNPFYSSGQNLFIIPEFKNVKNKSVYVVKKGYDVYRLDFSEFDPASYKYNQNTYETLIVPGAKANVSVTLDNNIYNMVLSLLHHSHGDIDGASAVSGEAAQKAIMKKIEERDRACSNYTCGGWDKGVYFGKINGLRVAENIQGVKLSKQTEVDYVKDLMMSSIIGELNGRFFHPEYYSSEDNYIEYKNKMQTKCSNVFVGL